MVLIDIDSQTVCKLTDKLVNLIGHCVNMNNCQGMKWIKSISFFCVTQFKV